MSGDLFIAPVTFPEFRRTVTTPINITDLGLNKSIVDEIDDPEEVRVWGVKNSRLNRSFYDKMSLDDDILFYNNGRYRYRGKIGEKFETEKISDRYWDGIEADMIYTVHSLDEIDISNKVLNEACDYKQSFQPQSLLRVSTNSLWNLKLEYDSVDEFVNKVRNV